MNSNAILAFDAGTSGVKVSAVTGEGKIIGAVTENYPTHCAPGGISEQNPSDWWRAVIRAVNALIGLHPELADTVAAMGVSGHMLGCIPVDAQGNALHPCMIHSDTRATKQCEKIARIIGAKEMYARTGNILDARSSLTKQLWVKEELPDVYKATAKFLQCKDYITSRLTGNIDTTDYSDAAHGELADIAKGEYDDGLFGCLGLDANKQPTLKAGTDIAGYLTDDAAKLLGLKAGIPVIVGGGDGACGGAGAGNIAPGDAFLSLGSTAWIARVAKKPVSDEKGRVFNIPNLDGKTVSVYGAMQSAGSSVNWVMRLLSVNNYDEFNAMAASIEPGARGLVYLPYLDGERTPVFDPDAFGVFAGMSASHTPSHFARAAFEGVAYALRQIADIMREYGELYSLRVIGGGADSTLFTRIIADVARLSLKKLNVPHQSATALGIAAGAAVGAGMYPDMAAALSHIAEVGEIPPAKSPVPEYERNYTAYLKLYPAMRGLWGS